MTPVLLIDDDAELIKLLEEYRWRSSFNWIPPMTGSRDWKKR